MPSILVVLPGGVEVNGLERRPLSWADITGGSFKVPKTEISGGTRKKKNRL